MTIGAELPERAPLAHAYDPVLRWMIFTGVSLFAAVVAWRYGLIRLMVASDRTFISSAIVAFYLGASLYALQRAWMISLEAAETAKWRDAWAGAAPGVAGLTEAARRARGAVGLHLRELLAKARAQGGGRVDQGLMLRALADRLRRGNGFVALAGDSLLKLGLIGTIVGFILMLGPVAGLDASDATALRASMSLMSEGMAVAMYTTLAGLVGSILLRAQYALIEDAAARLFWDVVRLTETHVLPALERGDV